jgi:hypothetical protein
MTAEQREAFKQKLWDVFVDSPGDVPEKHAIAIEVVRQFEGLKASQAELIKNYPDAIRLFKK